MPKKTTDQATDMDRMWVIMSEPMTPYTTRGGQDGKRTSKQPLKVEELTTNVNIFIQQLGKVLESTPDTLGKFHFEEFEIHADISADGTLAILGSGVHAGASSGLKFVFRRSSASSE
jgi:hypothetical protein